MTTEAQVPLSLTSMNRRAIAEITHVVEAVDPAEVEQFVEAIAAAGRIVCYGVGREGLMIKALCMRLYHLGLDAHIVGDMTTPPIAAGDILVVSAGPGHFSTVASLMSVAKKAGAKVACFTATQDGKCAAVADIRILLPAQTMATDKCAASSFLPMGSLYEGVQYLVYEYLVLMLRDRLGAKPKDMRARHTNLE